MAANVAAVAAVNSAKKSAASFSLTNLKRWSCVDKRLPDVASITNVHVYDFDNTLFASPLPNRQMWQGASIGNLQSEDVFVGGGWWHDPEVLGMTGLGVEKEEPRAWEGWWNEQIVDLVRLSMAQPDALTVLLTGRGEDRFASLIERIVKSKKLDFDLICLKPKVGPSNETFASTMKYKQAFLWSLVQTYSAAEEMRVYEDRPKHIEAFRTYFGELNSKYPLDPLLSSGEPRTKPINTEVIEVPSLETKLDPDAEQNLVWAMVRLHNQTIEAGNYNGKKAQYWAIKKQTLFTAYLIEPQDSNRLLALANLGAYSDKGDGTHRMANSIVITPRLANKTTLDKVGGMKAKLRWKAVALGNLDGKVFAARLQPVPLESSFYVESQVPHVVLATSGYGKAAEGNRITKWVPLPEDQQIEFDTTVGEKASVRLEESRMPNNSPAQNSNGKRPRNFDSDFPALPRSGHPPDNRRGSGHGSGQGRGFGNAANAGARGGRSGQKNDGGKGGGGRSGHAKGGQQRGAPGSGKKGGGRGGFGNYKSLDDMGAGAGGPAFGLDGANDDGGLSY